MYHNSSYHNINIGTNVDTFSTLILDPIWTPYGDYTITEYTLFFDKKRVKITYKM